ncbi:MAG: phospholipase D-like domain-containing protein [Planctomycetales bacterium]
MKTNEIERMLAKTLEDRRMSRNEKRALKDVFKETGLRKNELQLLRSKAFDLARAENADPEMREVLQWLEDTVNALDSVAPPKPKPKSKSQAYFSPGDDCPRKIASMFENAARKVDVCVFTITDNRIANAVLEAHRRGVTVRIISDDDKAGDAGSDVNRLEQSGLAVRVDRSRYHMHHKYALFDNSSLLTGSYNWTRGAAEYNEENFIITTEDHLVKSFSKQFNKLWKELA